MGTNFWLLPLLLSGSTFAWRVITVLQENKNNKETLALMVDTFGEKVRPILFVSCYCYYLLNNSIIFAASPYYISIVKINQVEEGTYKRHQKILLSVKLINNMLSCCCHSRSYCVRRTVTGELSNRFRIQYKFTNGWYERSDSTAEFMNAPKLYLLKRDHWAWQTVTKR